VSCREMRMELGVIYNVKEIELIKRDFKNCL